MSRFTLFMTLATLLVLTAPASAIDFGAQLIYGDDTDLGIGGRVEIPTPDLREQTRIAFDFNWYFPDDSPGADLTFWEINANWLHTIGTAAEGDPAYYLGGGLNFAYDSVDFDSGGDETNKDLGVNFLGGIAMPVGVVSVIGELRITIAGSEQYTLGVGLLF